MFVFIIFMLISGISVSAHPGRTDSQGGHYDRDTGKYHYHHGYPAHQHPNGICPYENNEKETTTRKYYSNSDSDGNSGRDSTTSITPKEKEQITQRVAATTREHLSTINKDDNKPPLIFLILFVIFLILFGTLSAIGILLLIHSIVITIQEYIDKERKRKELDRQWKQELEQSIAAGRKFVEEHKTEIFEIKQNIKKMKEERLLLIKKYNNFSAFKILNNIPGVPASASFYTDKKIYTNDLEYPVFGYTSLKGHCFHLIKGHCNSYTRHYLFDIAEVYYPCRVCAKNFREKYKWYYDIQDTIKLLEGIGLQLNYNMPELPQLEKHQLSSDMNITEIEKEENIPKEQYINGNS